MRPVGMAANLTTFLGRLSKQLKFINLMRNTLECLQVLYVIFIHSVTNTNSAHSGTVARYCLLSIFIEMFYPRTTRNY